MELYGRTELDVYFKEPDFLFSKHFIVVRYGWFSFAYLLDEDEDGTARTDMCRKASEISRAMLVLEA